MILMSVKHPKAEVAGEASLNPFRACGGVCGSRLVAVTDAEKIPVGGGARNWIRGRFFVGHHRFSNQRCWQLPVGRFNPSWPARCLELDHGGMSDSERR